MDRLNSRMEKEKRIGKLQDRKTASTQCEQQREVDLKNY